MQTRAQGATQLPMATYRTCHGQGATEYLVLLAVVLIVALVSVALLGFFPGMASDSQATQSKTYWSSASPIAVEEMDAYYSTTWGETLPVLIIKNNGAYPIRITKLLGGNARTLSLFLCHGTSTGFCPLTDTVYNISDYYYLAPGEKKKFMLSGQGMIAFYLDGSTMYGWRFYAASSICENSNMSMGTLVVNNVGFEYIEYIDGQQITKRQVGAKPLIIKCHEPAA